MRGGELVRSVTRKGQVSFHVEGDKAYLRVERDTLESAYGAVSPPERPEDFQALRNQAIEDHVDQVIEEMAPDHDVS